jgi:hypothetical protein
MHFRCKLTKMQIHVRVRWHVCLFVYVFVRVCVSLYVPANKPDATVAPPCSALDVSLTSQHLLFTLIPLTLF